MARPSGWLVRETLDFLDHSKNPLSDQAVRLFLLIEGFARSKPYCYPGNARLMEAVGKTKRGMQYSLAELEREGWIKRTLAKGEKVERTGFILLRRADPSMPCASSPEAIAQAEGDLLRIMSDRRGGKNLHPVGGKNLHRNKSPLRGDTSQAVTHVRHPSGASASPEEKRRLDLVTWAAEKAGDLIGKGWSDNDVVNCFFASLSGREATRKAIVATIGDRYVNDDHALDLVQEGINIAIDLKASRAKGNS